MSWEVQAMKLKYDFSLQIVHDGLLYGDVTGLASQRPSRGSADGSIVLGRQRPGINPLMTSRRNRRHGTNEASSRR
jgi:hypothetical protein